MTKWSPYLYIIQSQFQAHILISTKMKIIQHSTTDLCFHLCSYCNFYWWLSAKTLLLSKLTTQVLYSQLLLKQFLIRSFSNSFGNRFYWKLLKRGFVFILLLLLINKVTENTISNFNHYISILKLVLIIFFQKHQHFTCILCKLQKETKRRPKFYFHSFIMNYK